MSYEQLAASIDALAVSNSVLVDAAVQAQTVSDNNVALAEAAAAEAQATLADKASKADLTDKTDPTKGAGPLGYLGRTLAQRFAEQLSIKDKGAKGDGVTNDAPAELAAYTEAGVAGAVRYPPGSYAGIEAGFNMYGNSLYNRALDKRVQVGRNSVPTTDSAPIDWVQKFSAATRDTIPTNFDQVRYTGLLKKGGSAYGVADTAYALYSAGTGDLIAQHSRLKIQASGQSVRGYAGWMYVDVDSPDIHAAHAVEYNARNQQVDFGWNSKLQLIRLCMADSADTVNRFGSAITIGQTTHGGDNGFWSGLVVEDGAIIKTPGALDNGEIARFKGPAAGGSIGGVRFETGIFKFALRTDEATFANNNVLLLGTSQRIRWGDVTTGVNITAGSTSLALTNGLLNIATLISGTALQVAGVKVLGARAIGWEADAGVAKRTANTTFSQTVPASYTQASVQLMADALRDTSQALKALKDDLISHGLIGT